MTTQTQSNMQGLVHDIRKIRDEISNEIKDMTFEEERAYLDKLLAEKQKPAPNIALPKYGQDVEALNI
jgi:hypothetical protein